VVFSLLTKTSWAENEMDRMASWAKKFKLAEKYFNEISIFGDRFSKKYILNVKMS
jgi:hypothetical protein